MRSCILCVHIETSSLWAEFVNKNSVRLVSEEVKSIKFGNFDNTHKSVLRPEYFIDFFMWKMDPMSGGNIRLVFTLSPRDSKLQYKRCVHFWNNSFFALHLCTILNRTPTLEIEINVKPHLCKITLQFLGKYSCLIKEMYEIERKEKHKTLKIVKLGRFVRNTYFSIQTGNFLNQKKFYFKSNIKKFLQIPIFFFFWMITWLFKTNKKKYYDIIILVNK